MDERYLSAVMSGRGAAIRTVDNWRVHVRTGLEDDGWTFTVEGDLHRGRSHLGSVSFRSREDVAAEYGDRPWYPLVTACPWVGSVVGYVEWTVLVGQASDLAAALALGTLGDVVRLEDDRRFAPVQLQSFELAEATLPHGFADGDALLFREGPYIEDAVRRFQRAYEARGIGGVVGLRSTHHNPLRHSGTEPPRAMLEGGSVELWVLDVSVFEEP